MGGGWGGRGGLAIAGGARMGARTGHMAAWNGGRIAAGTVVPGNWNRFHHGHFVHRHGRVFFVAGHGGAVTVTTTRVVGSGFELDRGPQRIWVCGSYY